VDTGTSSLPPAPATKDPTPAKAPEKKEGTVATPKEIWTHEIHAPWVAPGEDDMWQAQTHLRVMHSHVRSLGSKVHALTADSRALREELAATRAELGEVLALLRGQAERAG